MKLLAFALLKWILILKNQNEHIFPMANGLILGEQVKTVAKAFSNLIEFYQLIFLVENENNFQS